MELEQRVLSDKATSAGIDKSKLIDDLRDNIVEALATEVQNRFSAEAQRESHVSLLRNLFRSDNERLLNQILLLRKRGNLNLAIGVSTTLLAAGILVFMVSGVNLAIRDTRGLIAYYIPRVSTVIFVEVFSFFFLRLYKAALEEEKYYQNEITARTARQAALEAALKTTDEGAMVKLIENFSLVNQNKPSAELDSQTAPDLKDLANLVESAAKIISSTAEKTH